MKFSSLRKSTRFDKVVLGFNALAALGLVICYLSSVLSPETFPLIAMWGLTFPFLLITNIIFIIYWLIRNYKLSLVSLLTIAVGAKFIYANYHLPGNFDTEKPPGHIRMLSYNVNSFTKVDGVTSTRNAIVKLLKGQQPDIVCIQEYAVRRTDSGQTPVIIKKELGLNNTYFRNYIITTYDSTGLALFTKYPIINHGDVPNSQTQAIYFDVKYNDKIIRLYNIHLQSTHFEAPEHQCIQDIVHFRKINWQEVGIIYNKIRTAFIKRAHQAEAIKAHMQQSPYPYLVAGDCNDTPNSYVVNKLWSGIHNGYVNKGKGIGTTYYRDFPPLQIDYIFGSTHFKFRTFNIVKDKISDHYPVVSDVELN